MSSLDTDYVNAQAEEIKTLRSKLDQVTAERDALKERFEKQFAHTSTLPETRGSAPDDPSNPAHSRQRAQKEKGRRMICEKCKIRMIPTSDSVYICQPCNVKWVRSVWR